MAKQLVLCLTLCGLALAGRTKFEPLIPYTNPSNALPLEFLQTQAQTRTSYPNQQYVYPLPPNYNGFMPQAGPSGVIPNVSPLTPVATANAGDVISVGNLDSGRFNLPPPPQYTPDIEPLANCLGCPEQIQLNMQENRISNLMTRINNKQKAIDDHEVWIDSANNELGRVQTQIDQTEENRQKLQEEMDALMKQKTTFEAEVKADQLSSDLKAAKKQQADMDKQSQNLASATRAIELLEGKLTAQTEDVGAKLNLSGKDLKNKMQELQDADSPLVAPFQNPEEGM
jgi:peptidoglycan hydrolase CwlO-like protein